MSVVTLTTQETFNAFEQLSNQPEIIEVIENTPEFIEYKKSPLNNKVDGKYFFGIAMRYALISNHIAYAVNYGDSVDVKAINEELESVEAEKISNQDAQSIICSLYYNIFTNTGTCFLENRWANVIKAVQELSRKLYEEQVEIPSAWIN